MWALDAMKACVGFLIRSLGIKGARMLYLMVAVSLLAAFGKGMVVLIRRVGAARCRSAVRRGGQVLLALAGLVVAFHLVLYSAFFFPLDGPATPCVSVSEDGDRLRVRVSEIGSWCGECGHSLHRRGNALEVQFYLQLFARGDYDVYIDPDAEGADQIDMIWPDGQRETLWNKDRPIPSLDDPNE